VLAAAGYNFSLLRRRFERLLRALWLIIGRAVYAPHAPKRSSRATFGWCAVLLGGPQQLIAADAHAANIKAARPHLPRSRRERQARIGSEAAGWPGHRFPGGGQGPRSGTGRDGESRLDGRKGKELLESHIRGRSQPQPQCPIAGKLHQRPCAGIGIDEKTFAPLTDDLPAPGDIGRHDRSAGGRRLHQALWEPFPHRQQHGDVMLAVATRHVIGGPVPIYPGFTRPSPQHLRRSPGES
jgi:hypothetical protein